MFEVRRPRPSQVLISNYDEPKTVPIGASGTRFARPAVKDTDPEGFKAFMHHLSTVAIMNAAPHTVWGGPDRKFLEKELPNYDEVWVENALTLVWYACGANGGGQFPKGHSLSLAGATDAFSLGLDFVGPVFYPTLYDENRRHRGDFDAKLATQFLIDVMKAIMRRRDGKRVPGLPPLTPFTASGKSKRTEKRKRRKVAESESESEVSEEESESLEDD